MKKLISGILVLSMVLGGLMMLPLMSFAADDDLPILGNRGDGLARGRDIHDPLALQCCGNLGERRVLALCAGVGHRAVLEQRDIGVLRQRNLVNLTVIRGFHLDVGHVAVSPEVEVAVGGDDGGELVARLELHHVPRMATA